MYGRARLGLKTGLIVRNSISADFRRVFVLAGRARGRAAQLLAGLAHRGVRLIDDADPT